MKILVTGGTGFIGSHAVEELVAGGHNVTVLALSSRLPEYCLNLKDKVQFFRGDFRNTAILKDALIDVNCVVHLAWTTLPQSTTDHPGFDVQSNVVGTINLLENCIKHDVTKIVFISSGGTVYGIPNSIPITESDVVYPICAYGISKLAVEKYIHLYHHLYSLEYIILRVSNAYGERQNLLKGQGVIGIWLYKLFQQKTLEIWGDGSTIRDYIYVKDVAKAIRLAVETHNKHGVFNTGTGQGYSLKQLLSIIGQSLGISVDVKFKQARKFDVPVNVLDISKIKHDLAWFPSTHIDQGVARVWRWIQETH